jgi:3-hydroxybutyryl-CoA dehydrogenase
MNQPSPIQSVLVAGAGTIGIGVARAFAAHGFATTVQSRNPARLAGQLPASVRVVHQLPAESPDLVIESIPEFRELKHQLYADVEAAYGGAPVLASNTSSLPLEELAAGLAHPERFIGMHYLYPADSMEFVEVMRTERTGDAAVAAVTDALARSGKTPIVLNRPVIGALVNRLQHALLREAYYLIGEGIVTPEQVDDVARRLLAPRMCVTGLLEQKDISGLDTHALAQRSIVPHLYNEPKPTPYLQDLYASGKVGLKAGSGFYDWQGADPAKVRAHATEKVARILALMEEIGVGRGRSLPK